MQFLFGKTKTLDILLWVFFYIFAFIFLLIHSYGYLDPDFGWHLDAGKEILTTGNVPRFVHHNYLLEGKKWVDHEWLLNLITFLIYGKGGYFWVNFLFVIIVLLSLLVLVIYTRKFFLKEEKDSFFIFLFLLFGLLAMSPHFGVRMQEITVLNFTLLLAIIYFFDKTGKTKILFFLPFLFYFWVNVHAGFLIGLSVLILFIIVKILELTAKKYKIFFIENKNCLPLKKIGIFFLLFLFSFVSTLFTPYGLNLYLYLGDYFTNTFYSAHISEWLSPFTYPANIPQFFFLTFAVAIVFVYATKHFPFREKKINLWNASIFLLFLILAIKSKRHFPLFFYCFFSGINKNHCCYFFQVPPISCWFSEK